MQRPRNPQKFHIRNWDEYQAYKHRNPPWVRLYNSLLTSRDWVRSDNDARTLMIVLILLASRDGGYVVNDPEYIALEGRLSVAMVVQKVPELVQLGFLECDKRLKSKAIRASICTHLYPNAGTDTESDTESEKKDNTIRARARTSVPEIFPTDIDRQWALRHWRENNRDDLCEAIDTHMAECRDHHLSKGTLSADWPATWRTWAQRAIRYNRKAKNDERKPTAHENLQQGTIMALAKLAGDG